MWTFIEPLTIPIGVFHGEADNLTSMDAVKEFEERCKKAGKTNVRFQYFEGLDHSLGIGSYFVTANCRLGIKRFLISSRRRWRRRNHPSNSKHCALPGKP